MNGPGLKVERITIRRGGRAVVRDVSFEAAAGEIVAVIGPNGAGKSSLLEGIVGELPFEGSVAFGGHPLRRLGDRARLLSWMPDEAEPPAELSVASIADFALRSGARDPALERSLRHRLGLEALLSARGGELSRGEKRRVSLFAALCGARPLAVLDEPLGTFDPLQLLEVCEVLRERARAGACIVLSVHQMADAEKIATRLLLLDGGEVVAFGSLDELRARVGRPAAPLEEIFIELLRARRSHAAA